MLDNYYKNRHAEYKFQTREEKWNETSKQAVSKAIQETTQEKIKETTLTPESPPVTLGYCNFTFFSTNLNALMKVKSEG